MLKRMMIFAAVIVALGSAKDAEAGVLYRYHHYYQPRVVVGTTVAPYYYNDVAVAPVVYYGPRYHYVYRHWGHYRRW